MALSDSLLILTLALAIEAAFSYPHRLYTWIGHPVTWIGMLIKVLDRGLNRDGWSFGQRRAACTSMWPLCRKGCARAGSRADVLPFR